MRGKDLWVCVCLAVALASVGSGCSQTADAQQPPSSPIVPTAAMTAAPMAPAAPPAPAAPAALPALPAPAAPAAPMAPAAPAALPALPAAPAPAAGVAPASFSPQPAPPTAPKVELKPIDKPFKPTRVDAQTDPEAKTPRRQPDQLPTPLTVGDLIEARHCSTALTTRLSAQLAAQMNCIKSDIFSSITDIPNVRLDQAANPFIQSRAARALRHIASTRPNKTFHINSSWRSVVQQHVLKGWEGSCGIRIAADPGTSNHESGLAIDVPWETTRDFKKSLKRNNWLWYCEEYGNGRRKGCKDVPHHTFQGGRDVRRLSVKAFQMLWNNAHPNDRIKVNGVYDKATARRINKAPLEGFAAGTTCGNDALAFYRAAQKPTDKPVSPERYIIDLMLDPVRAFVKL